MLCDRQTELWDKIKDSVSTLKTYIVPSVRRLPPIRRLERLAGSLSDFELRPDAPNEAEEAMLSVLSNRLKQLQGDDTFNDVIEQSRKIGLSATILSYVTGATEDQTIQIELTSRSLERLFEQVGNRIGAGLHEQLWRRIPVRTQACLLKPLT